MRITFEPDDLQAIAEIVARKLAPLIGKLQETAASPIPPTTKQVPIREPEALHVTKTVGEVIRRKELCQITGYQ